MSASNPQTPVGVQQRLQSSWKRLAVAIILCVPLYAVWSVGVVLRNYGLEGQLYGEVRQGDVPRALRTLDQLGHAERYSNNALIQAARRGQLAMVKALVPLAGREARTLALRKAVATQNRDIILTLAMAGADLDAPDDDGLTPLMVVARYISPACVVALLEAGADSRVRDSQGKTARDYALKARRWKNGRLLHDAMRKQSESRKTSRR